MNLSLVGNVGKNGWRRRYAPVLWCLLIAFSLCPAVVMSQEGTEAGGAVTSTGRPPEVRVAANEETLWLARVERSGSTLFRRSITTPFDRGRPINGRIASMAAVDRDAIVFFEDGEVYRYFEDPAKASPRDVLPGRQQPLDVVASATAVHALVPSSVAKALSGDSEEAPSMAASRPFDPGDAPLSVIQYDGQRWSPTAACPAGVRAPGLPRLQPRLCHVHDHLLLFWLSEEHHQIHYARLDLQAGGWQPGGTAGLPNATAFWVVLVNRVPTLVAASAGADGSETPAGYRLLAGAASAETDEWQPARLHFSSLPAGISVGRCLAAVGFNQHLGLLVLGSDGATYLRFARFGAEPAEQTVAVANVFAGPPIDFRIRRPWQVLSLLVLLGIFTALFVFRREAMVQAIALPPGWQIAFVFQRLMACLIDFVPFAVAAATKLSLSWLDAFRELTVLAIGTDATGSLPRRDVLLWWGLSAGGYTLYSLVMETLTRRTVGKVCTGVRLLSESGTPPALWQVLTRNLFRVIELLPPFWVLAFLALLTRNRQRLGDIFARTVAVRKAKLDQKMRGPSEPPDIDTPGSSDSSDT